MADRQGPQEFVELVASYLESRDLPYSIGASGNVVAFPASTSEHSWSVYAVAREEQSQLVVHSVRDARVPSDRREAMGEFVNRANYGLVLGNLEIDLEDGEMRFKTSIDVEGDRLSAALIDQLILSNVAIFGRYLPGVDAVVNGEDPAAAIDAIEGDGEDE